MADDDSKPAPAVLLPCSRCGAVQSMPGDAWTHRCHVCGTSWRFIRCRGCEQPYAGLTGDPFAPHLNTATHQNFPTFAREVYFCPWCRKSQRQAGRNSPRAAHIAAKLRSEHLSIPEDADRRAFHMVLIGGYGHRNQNGAVLFVDFRFTEVCVAGGSDGLSIPYADVTELSIGGAGRITTYSGGGAVGVAVPIEGMTLIGGSATPGISSTSCDTTLTVQTSDLELVLHSAELSPEELQIVLSPVFGRIRKARAHALPPASEPEPGPTLAEQLRQLAELFGNGLLTESEFADAKESLLRSR